MEDGFETRGFGRPDFRGKDVAASRASRIDLIHGDAAWFTPRSVAEHKRFADWKRFGIDQALRAEVVQMSFKHRGRQADLRRDAQRLVFAVEGPND